MMKTSKYNFVETEFNLVEGTCVMNINATTVSGQDEILTPAAMDFLEALEEKFGERRRKLIRERSKLQNLNFPAETVEIRNSDWTIRPLPQDLLDRRVEITGAVERRTIVEGLNSGANVFMADFEDLNTPTWENQMLGQMNLRDAHMGVIGYSDADGKDVSLDDETAVLMVRTRGLHMEEGHILYRDEPMSAAFFDFGLYLYHFSSVLLVRDSGPYFYLPKLASYHEARLWNDVLVFAEDYLGLDRGCIRVTVLIETITAGFQIDEIIYELKDHIAGLNCGSWDYIFSFLKHFAENEDYIFPEREQLNMDNHFLRSCGLHIIKTCHRRGALAIGGNAAQLPMRNDEEARLVAIDQFTMEKEREVKDGYDGSWVDHPGLIKTVQEIFGGAMEGSNQLYNKRNDVTVTVEDLLTPPTGTISERSLRKNINVGLLYMRSWLSGKGTVPLYNQIEEVATVEIARTQLWQWRYHQAKLEDGRTIDDTLMDTYLMMETSALKQQFGDDQYLKDACILFRCFIMAAKLEEFLTTCAYNLVVAYESNDNGKCNDNGN